MASDQLEEKEPVEGLAQRILLLGGRLCLDFTNTLAYRATDRQVDALVSYEALVRWSEHAGAISLGEKHNLLSYVGTPIANATFDHARALRDVIYDLFVAGAHEQAIAADTLQSFNAALEQVLAHRRIAITAEGPTWTWQNPNAPGQILWPIVYSAAEVLTSPGLPRVRQCPGCGWLFLDESRNGNRTWCDMRFCGNRAKAQRHYERRKQL